MILLDLKPTGYLSLQIVHETPDDRERIQSLPVKKLVTKNVNGLQVWDHWEIPYEDISLLYERWPGEVLASPAAEQLYKLYQWEMIPTEQLPPYSGPINWGRPPKNERQEGYVRQSLLRPRILNDSEMGCVDGEAVIHVNRAGLGKKYTIKEAYKSWHQLRTGGNWKKGWNRSIPTYVRSWTGSELRLNELKDIIYSGIKETVILRTKAGREIKVTPEHEIAMAGGIWRQAQLLRPGDFILGNGQYKCPLCERCFPELKNLVQKKKSPAYGVCHSCAQVHFSKKGKGGRFVDSDGYVCIYKPGHHRAVHGQNHVYEHIVVMEEKLGRPIGLEDYIHHKDENKANNSPDNLEVLTPSQHLKEHKAHARLHGGSTYNGGTVWFVPELDEIVSISPGPTIPVYDLVMADPHRSFVANGIVVHNSGKSWCSLERIRLFNWSRCLLISVQQQIAQPEWPKQIRASWPGQEILIYVGSIPQRQKLLKEVQNVPFVLTTYELFHELNPYDFDCFIFDECFPSSTMVTTEFGPLSIQTIVDGKLPVRVWSKNLRTGQMQLKEVTGWLKTLRRNRLVKIRHSAGELICTEDHKIWTARGWINAIELLPGETLFGLQSAVPETKEIQQNTVGTNAILQSDLLGAEDGCIESDGERDFSSSYVRDFAQNRTQAESTWRKRHGINSSAEIINGAIAWISGRIRSLNQIFKISKSKSAEELQNRLSLLSEEDSGRNRRGITFGIRSKAARRKKEFGSERIRVDSVEVYQQSSEPDFVYCLNVSANHNFYADGILVSNCHLWNNPDTNRYQRMIPVIQATWAKPNIPVQVLTGTPIGNRIATMWPLLHCVSPLCAGSREAFSQTHEIIEKMGSRIIRIENADGSISARKVYYPTATRTQNLDLLEQKHAASAYRITQDEMIKYKRTTKFIDIQMTPRQWELYHDTRNDLLDSDTASKWGTKNAKVKLLRLLQIAEGPFNLPEEETNFDSGKLNYILEAFVDAKDKRCLWARFEKMPRLVQHLFKDRAVLWSGAVSREEKELAMIAFNGTGGDEYLEKHYKKLAHKHKWKFEPGEAQFFCGVIDLRSSLGMNLQRCSHQYFTSFALSLIANIQTMGRIIRADSITDEVITEILLAKDTWEKPAFQYLLNRWKEAQMILDGKESVSANDLLQLLEFVGVGRKQSRWFVRAP